MTFGKNRTHKSIIGNDSALTGPRNPQIPMPDPISFAVIALALLFLCMVVALVGLHQQVKDLQVRVDGALEFGDSPEEHAEIPGGQDWRRQVL